MKAMDRIDIDRSDRMKVHKTRRTGENMNGRRVGRTGEDR